MFLLIILKGRMEVSIITRCIKLWCYNCWHFVTFFWLYKSIPINVGLGNTVSIEKNAQNFLKPIVTFNVSIIVCLQVLYTYFH